MLIRTPAVAGMFYPKEKDELKTVIHDCFLHPFGPGKVPPVTNDENILGVICPHAGYMYSGPIATNSFYSISSQKPELVIIVPQPLRILSACTSLSFNSSGRNAIS